MNAQNDNLSSEQTAAAVIGSVPLCVSSNEGTVTTSSCPVETVAETETAVDAESEEGKVRRGRKPDLKRLRTVLGLNQCELAKSLNVTQAMVSMIESGKAKPGRDLWNKIYELSQQSKR